MMNDNEDDGNYNHPSLTPSSLCIIWIFHSEYCRRWNTVILRSRESFL